MEINKDHPHESKQSANSELALMRKPVPLLVFGRDSRAIKEQESFIVKKREGFRYGLRNSKFSGVLVVFPGSRS